MIQYRYNIEMHYMYNNQLVVFNSTNIYSVMIDYDYDTKHMPMIFINLNADKNVVDDMIKNFKTSTINLFIKKYIKDDPVKLKKNYIEGEFIYFVTDDMNTNQSLDYSKDRADAKDVYRKITIGLLKSDLIKNNKITINDTIQNTKLMDTLVYYLTNKSKMKLLIEPTNDVTLDKFPIPPINSISKLVEILDQNFSIYKNNKYRLFYDFDKTYLLSSNGTAIQSIDEAYPTIILKVMNTVDTESKLQGFDIENSSYIIYIASTDININRDKASYISNSATMAIDPNGNTQTSGDGDQYKIIRTTNNLNSAATTQSNVDNNSFTMNIVKTELDTSLLTINKEYMIQNYPGLSNYDGKFLLSRKRDIYTPQDSEFLLSNMLTFRKAIS